MGEEEQSDLMIAFRGLLAQLYLPVYRMRLITAQKVAQLLEENRELYQDAYLTWLSECAFESEVVTGLCILGLMKRDSLIDQTLVRSHIKKSSIMSDICLEKIYSTATAFISWLGQHSGAPKSDFRETHRYKEMSTTYAAPVFRNDLEEWERKSGRPLLKQWAWEFENLEPLLKNYESSPSYFYDDTDRWEHGGSYHLRMADVFHSAYLRTLAYAVSSWDMPIQLAAMLSANCVPLDFELAKVNPIKKPKKFIRLDVNQQSIVQKNGLTETLENLANWSNEVLVASSFPLCRTKLFSADMHIRSVLVTEKEPPAERVFKITHTFLSKMCMFHQWNKQDGLLIFMEEWDSGEGFSPAAFKIYPKCFPFWQNEIIMCGVHLPSPLLIGGRPDIEYLPNEMLFKVNGQAVARWVFWYDNWRTSHLRELNAGIGTALLVNKDVLATPLQVKPYQLKTVAHVKYLMRNREYDNFEVGDVYSDLISSE